MARVIKALVVFVLLVLVGLFLLCLIFGWGWCGFDSYNETEGELRLIIEFGEEGSFPESSLLSQVLPVDKNRYEGCGLRASCGDDDPYKPSEDDEDVICELASDCGENYYEEDYCWFGNVYRNYYYFTCNDGCDENLQREKIEECLIGCDSGNCFEPECMDDTECESDELCDVGGTYQCREVKCSENLDCDDGNGSTDDICMEPGTVESYCINEGIKCFIDLDCGFNDYIGERTCNETTPEEDVFQDYRIWGCQNPGTAESLCGYSLNYQIVHSCEIGLVCDLGVCI
jgi:hypothetical protein